MLSDERTLDMLSGLSPERRNVVIARYAKQCGFDTADEAWARLNGSWAFEARTKQVAPEGDWMFWFLMAGRGFGKTKSAAEWTKTKITDRKCRWGVVAPTLQDARQTCFEGVSGLLSVLPNEALLGGNRDIAWNRGEVILRLANGTEVRGFSSERPDRLRGPELDGVWMEELSSWDDARHGDQMDTTWSNALLALRGDAFTDPQGVITSTPKANKLTRHVAGLGSVVLVRGSSYENQSNLPDAWWQAVVAPMQGTRTGRQEIEAELLEDVEGALWTRSVIDTCRVKIIPGTEVEAILGWQRDETLRDLCGSKMKKIYVGVDPNTTSGESADNAGVVVCGIAEDNHGYVLDDRSITRGGPAVWRAAAVDAYHDWEADKIIAESNNGGEMVDMVIKGFDRTVPVELVTASRGKRTRAEPIAALYVTDEEHDKEAVVHHVGVFPDLEDELTSWTPADESPGRLDGMVWAMTKLKVWQPAAGQGSFVDRGDIPGIVELGSGLLDG
jgi:phage terminase large subunit-like protein